MAKREINFVGPSIKDLGIDVIGQNIVVENALAETDTNTASQHPNHAVAEPAPKVQAIETSPPAVDSITDKKPNKRGILQKTRYRTVQFDMVRDYLRGVLDGTDHAEIKIPNISKELHIAYKTVLCHLETIRDGDAESQISEIAKKIIESVRKRPSYPSSLASLSARNATQHTKYRTVQFDMVRDYLRGVLDGTDHAEIKIHEMAREININFKTVCKYLKILRNTEFIITRFQYGLEVRRRKPEESASSDP
ncbi:hypothetical protein FACS1894187_16020 [Synergistales bacterium]|nr:hypothetical protein FACS1894187_16020 [Synergistales bacterium]